MIPAASFRKFHLSLILGDERLGEVGFLFCVRDQD
jgi:hypothetical protein